MKICPHHRKGIKYKVIKAGLSYYPKGVSKQRWLCTKCHRITVNPKNE